MAKRKKRRTAAQRAATAKMIAANKRRRRSNPAKRKAPKKVGVKTSKSGRVRSVKMKSGQTASKRLTAGARKLRAKAHARTRTGVTRTYKYYKKPRKYGVIIRENPANRTKSIVAAAGGFALGIVAADVLDRYIATRKTDTAEVSYGTTSKARVAEKADGVRIFAQAAGTGVSAVGAYMLRKKSVVGTYLLGGMAAAFAAKGLGMVLKDHIMPALFKSVDGKTDSTSIGRRLGYVNAPRSAMMGAPRPFQGKPAHVGPSAGSVGGYGCTRVPVNPSAFAKPGESRENCKPYPFAKAPSASGGGGMMQVEPVWDPGLPGVVQPQPTPVPPPRVPGDVPAQPQSPGFAPGRGFAPKPSMPFQPGGAGLMPAAPAGVVPPRFSAAPASVADKIRRTATPIASRLKPWGMVK